MRAPSMVIFATRLCSRHNLSTDVRCITPLRGRCRYLAQRCAINICRNNQAVGKTDNTWYGKENEKKTVNTQVQMHNLAKKCEKAAKLMTKFFRNSC